MIRGTFANIRLRNQIAPGTEGGFTRDFTQPGGPVVYVYDASVNYQAAGIPLVVLAGKEYGSGSSRDWAAKGTTLLGVQGRHRRELRAHPPLEPDRHGRPARCSSRRARTPTRSAWTATRSSTSPASPSSTRARTPKTVHVVGDEGRRRGRRVRRRRAHRHPRRGRLLPQRRHPAVRAAVAAEEVAGPAGPRTPSPAGAASVVVLLRWLRAERG